MTLLDACSHNCPDTHMGRRECCTLHAQCDQALHQQQAGKVSAPALNSNRVMLVPGWEPDFVSIMDLVDGRGGDSAPGPSYVTTCFLGLYLVVLVVLLAAGAAALWWLCHNH
jgi:hypothetical protein